MRQPHELIEEVQRAFESGDFGRFPELVAPDAEIRNPFTTVHGPAEFAALGQGFTAAVSDRRIEVLDVVADGSAAIAQIRVTGRHTGAMPLPDGEAPPTGNAIAFEEAGVVRVRDGRIASWHSYYDGLELARQLGIATAAATG
jgi:limonene-1,2-epoxide hydrolase